MSKKKYAVVALCDNPHSTCDFALILRADFGGHKRIYIKCPSNHDETVDKYHRKGWYESVGQAREYAAMFFIGKTFILPWDDDYKMLLAEVKLQEGV